MANDGSAQSQTNWPLVRFQFQVKWDNHEILFQEVTGLGSESQVIEYRGDTKIFEPVKMPGNNKFGNVTLKKGIFKGDAALWQQFANIRMNTIKPSTVVINLLDESNATAMSWNLANAFPTKVTITDMRTDAGEVAVELMEMAHEGLSLVK